MAAPNLNTHENLEAGQAALRRCRGHSKREVNMLQKASACAFFFSFLINFSSAVNADQYRLAPTVDLQLAPVQVHVPEKFSFLGDDLVFELPPGFEARIFAATGLEGPRFMAWSPEGVLHVANMKVDSPSQWSPAADRASGQIVALPDLDRDGVADTQRVVADGFWWAHSLAFYKGDLYVADTDKVYRMLDGNGDGFYETREIFVDDLPTFNNRGGSNHVTKAIVFDAENERFFLNVGSSCDLCREDDPERASVLVFNADGSGRRVYARGVRNTAGLDLHPLTGELWATHNGHDREGGELPPEWISPIRADGFYGWPFGHANRIFVDFGIYDEMLPLSGADSLSVLEMDVPAALIPAHLAPIGIHFYARDLFPPEYRNVAFAALRGGRFGGNLATVPGFKVVAVFSEPDGSNARVADFLTGFGPSNVRDNLWGKPVGLTTDEEGHLFVSSDHTNSVIVRIGLQTLYGHWEQLPPDTLLSGRAAELRARVRLERLAADGEQPELVADLSALGGGAAVSLTPVDENLYELRATLPVDVSNGLKEVRVRITQNTPQGAALMLLPAAIVVLPGTNLLVLDDALSPGWQGRGFLGASTPDFETSGPVFQGQHAGILEVKPRSNRINWSMTLTTDELVETAGYRSLRFAFHPGTLSGSSLELLVTTLYTERNIPRKTYQFDLLAGPTVLDLNRREWQIVDIPLANLALQGPIESIGFAGNLEGTFSLDALGLVSAAPTLYTAVRAAQSADLPASFALAQNYPNPFNGNTVIHFALPVSGRIELAVYNAAGQRVATLADGWHPAGRYGVHWDGVEEGGRALASGIYFYRLRAGARVEVRKLLLLR